MTTPGGDSDVLAAALIQISAHAERLGSLDARETSHHETLISRLHELGTDITALGTRISEISATLASHSATLASLSGLSTQVTALASQLTTLATGSDSDGDIGGYQPVASPRWWKLTGPDREAALDRLRAWIEQIYQPGYGQLAAMLPPCWELHPACLYTLDWLSELWSALYLGPQRDSRTLAAQAEWHTRLLPAAAEQMAYETTSCRHGPNTARHHPSPGSYPASDPRLSC